MPDDDTILSNGRLQLDFSLLSSGAGGGFLNLVVPFPQQQIVISALEELNLKYFPIINDTGGTSVHKSILTILTSIVRFKNTTRD